MGGYYEESYLVNTVCLHCHANSNLYGIRNYLFLVLIMQNVKIIISGCQYRGILYYSCDSSCQAAQVIEGGLQRGPVNYLSCHTTKSKDSVSVLRDERLDHPVHVGLVRRLVQGLPDVPASEGSEIPSLGVLDGISYLFEDVRVPRQRRILKVAPRPCGGIVIVFVLRLPALRAILMVPRPGLQAGSMKRMLAG